MAYAVIQKSLFLSQDPSAQEMIHTVAAGNTRIRVCAKMSPRGLSNCMLPIPVAPHCTPLLKIGGADLEPKNKRRDDVCHNRDWVRELLTSKSPWKPI
jgi:hypothetical protein